MAWRYYDADGPEKSLFRAVAASVLATLAVLGIIMPSLRPLFPSATLARVTSSKNGTGAGELKFDVKPGSWHHVRNEVAGSTLRVFLDDALVLTLTLPSGSGFFGSSPSATGPTLRATSPFRA